MLHHMGGSRKKVTTSRRSTQKRQRQYFEQRKRQLQLQQTAGAESYNEGISTYEQHDREPRSLDVINLLNLTTSAQECFSYVPNEVQEEQEFNASTVKQHMAKSLRTVGTKTFTSFSAKTNEARESSYNPALNSSPKKVLLNDMVDGGAASNGNLRKADIGKETTDPKLSLFDLVGDEIRDYDSGERPEREDHVAFLVEGLGGVGAETPVHSPKVLRRASANYFPLPQKAARRKSSKNTAYSLNDFELEVDTMMQDIDMPPHGRSLGISIEDCYSNPENKFSCFRDYKQAPDCSRTMKFSFDDIERFHDSENEVENMWDDKPNFLEESFLYQKKSNDPGNSLRCYMDSDVTDFIGYGACEMPNYPLEGLRRPRNRDTKKTTETLDTLLGSPVFGNRMLDKDHNFGTFPRTRSSMLHPKFKCDDIFSGSDWSYFPPEDLRDDLSLPRTRSSMSHPKFRYGGTFRQSDWSYSPPEDFKDDPSLPSEESCSSAAVGREEMNYLQSDSTAKSTISSNLYGSPERKYTGKNRVFDGPPYKIRDDLQQETRWSGKCNQTPFPSDKNQTNHSKSCFHDNLGPTPRSSVRERYCTVDMGAGLNSFCIIPEAKLPVLPSSSNQWDNDSFGALMKMDFDAEIEGLSPPRCDSFINCSPSSSSISRKYVLCQPLSPASPTRSKAAAKRIISDCISESSQENAGSSIELSAKESERKEEDETKRQSANNDKEAGERDIYGLGATSNIDVLDSTGNLPETKDLKGLVYPRVSKRNCDHEEETTSSSRFHECSSEKKGETTHEDIPLCSKNATEMGEVEVIGAEEGKTLNASPSSFVYSSHQVMMLQSNALEIVCFRKVLKGQRSAAHNGAGPPRIQSVESGLLN